MIRCYYARCPAPERTESLIPLLPVWRRERFEPLRHEGARRLSLCAGLLWAHAMKDSGFDPDAPVHTLPAGKPVTDGVWFSLSHSGEGCLCAVSDSSVGADVQAPQRVKLSLARRFCPAEYDYLQALPEAEQTGALLRLWTRKEAWVKAASRDRLLSLDEYNTLSPDKSLVFSDFVLWDGSYAAVCGAGPVPALIEVRL